MLTGVIEPGGEIGQAEQKISKLSESFWPEAATLKRFLSRLEGLQPSRFPNNTKEHPY
jgi:hypothetical protein